MRHGVLLRFEFSSNTIIAIIWGECGDGENILRLQIEDKTLKVCNCSIVETLPDHYISFVLGMFF